jgi:hypothetical protein
MVLRIMLCLATEQTAEFWSVLTAVAIALASVSLAAVMLATQLSRLASNFCGNITISKYLAVNLVGSICFATTPLLTDYITRLYLFGYKNLAGFSPRRPEFNPWWLQVIFVLTEVAMEQEFPRFLLSPANHHSIALCPSITAPRGVR